MNWGYKLTIGMLLFMGFISVLVFKMIRSKVDLVSDNYYESGITYQQKMQSAKNGETASQSVSLFYSDTNAILNIIIPQFDNGKVLLYRPSEVKEDFEENLTGNDKIDFKTKSMGKWKVKLNWNFEKVNYTMEKEFWVK